VLHSRSGRLTEVVLYTAGVMLSAHVFVESLAIIDRLWPVMSMKPRSLTRELHKPSGRAVLVLCFVAARALRLSLLRRFLRLVRFCSKRISASVGRSMLSMYAARAPSFQ
jgi:hypothetical protein